MAYTLASNMAFAEIQFPVFELSNIQGAVNFMSQRQTRAKTFPGRPGGAEARIVALSLQHPDCGPQRLVPLLEAEGFRVTSSAVYRVLRRHGLQNREKRLAQIKKRARKARKPESPPKKALPKITGEVAGRICEISLQNPDLGAKSLAPLMKEKGISVSSSAVYRILKHYNLQTRAKRYARAAEISSQPVIIPKTFPEKIPPEVEDRIAGISLQNPECGARRLIPLLQQEEIFVSVSAVYRILKHHELENRPKRLLKLEALNAPEAPPEPEMEGPEPAAEAGGSAPIAAVGEAAEPDFEPAVAVPIPPVDKTPAPAAAPEPAPESALAETAKPERPPVRKAPLKTIQKRGHPVFYPLYLLLFVLIGYLGLNAWQSIQYARLDTEAVQIDDSVTVGVAVKTVTSVQPLDGYRRIWERDLFNVSGKEPPAQHQEIAVEKLAPAEKDLGLKLVGTVVADDALLRRAFIDNSKTRRQEAFREGGTVGEVRIKKILRNKVVVATREGDRLLTFEIPDTGKRPIVPSPPQQAAAGAPAPRAQEDGGESEVPVIEARLDRAQVRSGLSKNDYMMQQVRVFPYTGAQGERQGGFRISNIRGGSVLLQMGLRSGDVILGVNGEAVAGPDDADGFFEKLAQGGDVTIQAMRRGRPVQLQLKIE